MHKMCGKFRIKRKSAKWALFLFFSISFRAWGKIICGGLHMENHGWQTDRLNIKIQELSHNLERAKILEYVSLMENPKRMLYLNFVAGLARGLGIAVGFSVLGAVAILILRRLVVLNLPLIGDFIAEIIKLVNRSM